MLRRTWITCFAVFCLCIFSFQRFGELSIANWHAAELSHRPGSPVEGLKPLCGDTSGRAGSWKQPNDSDTGAWFFEPDACRYHEFSSEDAGQCLHGRQLTFAGDSLLRNVVLYLVRTMDQTWNFPNAENMAADQHSSARFGKYSTAINFYWYCSAFHRKDISATKPWDVFVMGMTLWNMKPYNRGLTKYHDAVRSIAKMMKRVSKTRRWGWFGLHALYPTQCKIMDSGKKNEGCEFCNVPSRAALWRHAGTSAVACARSGTDAPENWLIDTYPMTNTSLAENDTSDGVHYAETVTKMQAQMLLHFVCKDWLLKRFGTASFLEPSSEAEQCKTIVTPKQAASDAQEYPLCRE
ncbi:hypothetical protein DIPPA_64563 [Diplonema papillatum]|nr:hypothetical protein DIPPA_64563 [Diplonema papillatum]